MKLISIKEISAAESKKIRLILAGTVALSFLTAKFYPLNILNYFFPGLFREDSSCILLNLTGLPCPFCGMSRAFSEFLKLNFLKSIYYNPASVIFFTFSGMFCLAIFVLSFYNYKFSVSFNRKTLFAFIAVILVIWLLNIFYGHH